MQRHMIAALAASTILLPTLALADSKTLDVETFHGVDVSAGIHAVVTGGAPQAVVADSANAQALTDLRYTVRDGVLHLWYDWTIGDIFDWSDRDVTVTISSELLDALEASSGASIDATRMMGEDISLEASSGAHIKTDKIEGMFYSIEASSGASIETSGFCTTAEVEVSSGASISAKDLDCGKVMLEASSAGSVAITARDTISAEVSSAGHATVYGKPAVEHLETSSAGSVDFPG